MADIPSSPVLWSPKGSPSMTMILKIKATIKDAGFVKNESNL